MSKFDLNLKFYSSYYISLLISYFILKVEMFYDFIFDSSAWAVSFIVYTPAKDLFSGNNTWFLYFLVYVIFVVIIQRFIAIPLDMFVHKDVKLNGFTKVLFPVIIFGFQIFLLNKISPDIAMPTELLPQNVINFFGGIENSYNTKLSGMEKRLWSPRDMFWYIGPIAILYYKAVLYKPKSE